MDRMKNPGTLSITRPSNADSPDHPMVRMTVKVRGRRMILEMPIATFGMAVTGASEVPIEVEGTLLDGDLPATSASRDGVLALESLLEEVKAARPWFDGGSEAHTPIGRLIDAVRRLLDVAKET
jgi:hypothetical protein